MPGQLMKSELGDKSAWQCDSWGRYNK